ncbi:MAG: AzlD domain-containing protein, partial [Boseongicola sp.]
MNYSSAEIWFIVAVMGVGTYLIRFSFLGLIGDRKMPDWVLRHLRYTPVAVLPGLVAPLVLWPAATGGDPDPARLIAAATTLAFAW